MASVLPTTFDGDFFPIRLTSSIVNIARRISSECIVFDSFYALRQIDRACCRTSKCTFLYFFYTFGQFDTLQPICIECSGFDFPESGRHNDLFKISVPKGILPHTRHRLRKLKSRMLLGILKRSVECICSDRFEFRRQGELLQAATTSECKIRYLCDVVIQLYFFQSLTTIKQRLAQFGRAFYRRFFSASIPAKDISSIFSTLAGTTISFTVSSFSKGSVFHRRLL